MTVWQWQESDVVIIIALSIETSQTFNLFVYLLFVPQTTETTTISEISLIALITYLNKEIDLELGGYEGLFFCCVMQKENKHIRILIILSSNLPICCYIKKQNRNS